MKTQKIKIKYYSTNTSSLRVVCHAFICQLLHQLSYKSQLFCSCVHSFMCISFINKLIILAMLYDDMIHCKSMQYIFSIFILFHTFSAFWLRSSVVSVLLSLISETVSNTLTTED